MTIWEHSFLKGLPSPVPQYWYIEAILWPEVVLYKPHDNDIEAGSCHWIFNWYIFTCFLPRLFMLYSHWSLEWLYFAFLFSFNLRMLFSGTSKYLQTTAFYLSVFILVLFFSQSPDLEELSLEEPEYHLECNGHVPNLTTDEAGRFVMNWRTFYWKYL